MSFTQPCFIRKNTPELRKKLEELEIYEHPSKANGNCLFVNRGFYASLPIGYTEETERAIDCGTNAPMFLALAALRDDSDNGQWFVLDNYFGSVNYPDTFHPQGSMVFCTEENWKDMPIFGNIHAHKATPEEIVEHFEKFYK